MDMCFEATCQNLLVAGTVVVVTFAFVQSTGKFPVFLIAGAVMGMFSLAAGEVSIFIKAGFIMLMFRNCTSQLFRDCIAVIRMVMSIGLLQPADQLFFIAICRMLMGGNSTTGLALHRDRRQDQSIGGNKYHNSRSSRNTAIPDFAKAFIFEKLADFFNQCSHDTCCLCYYAVIVVVLISSRVTFADTEAVSDVVFNDVVNM